MRDESDLIPVEFSGTAREYFGIWLVNLLLSIATLGIYSAWAKVRTKKYFHRNTSIADRRFNYHATGLQILLGRLIILAALVLWSVASHILQYGAAMAIAFVVILPWLINRGLRFNAGVTAWSHVRFRFGGSYWATLRVYVVYPFLSVLTLFLAYPYAYRAKRRYVIGNHQFAGKRFSFDGRIGPFYRALLVVVLWIAGWTVAGAAGAIYAIGGFEAFPLLAFTLEFGENLESATMVLYVSFAIAVLPASTIYNAFARNATYAGTGLEGGHLFVSRISALRLVLISMTNAIAIAASLGLLLPWARIRVARYLAAHTWVIPNGSLDEFAGTDGDRQSAIGDAFADVGGYDVGIGV